MMLAASSLQAQDWNEIKKEFQTRYASTEWATRVAAVKSLGSANNKAACDLLAQLVANHDAQLDKVLTDLEATQTKLEKYAGRSSFTTGEMEDRNRLTELAKTQAADWRGHEAVIDAASEALSMMGAAEATDWMVRSLTRKPWRLQVVIARALGRKGGSEAIKVLREKGLKQTDARALIAAIEALATAGAREAAEDIARQLQAKDWQTRVAAVGALADLGAADQCGALIDRMEKEEGRVREDIAEALVRLTGVNHDDNAAMWRSWYDANKDKLAARAAIDRQQARKILHGKQDKEDGSREVTFYGIKTSSNNIVFVIDISDSMNLEAGGQPGQDAKPDPGVVVTGDGQGKGPTAVDLKAREAIAAIEGGKKIDVAKRELIKAIAALPKKARFAIIWYNHDVMPWQREMCDASDQSKQQAFDEIKNLKATGATNIFDSLERGFMLAGYAQRDQNFKQGADTIFLLSDGSPNHGRFTAPDDILREVGKINAERKITIHTIGIGREHDSGFMQKLAEQNGGQYTGRN
jgi:HEAT repeat protein